MTSPLDNHRPSIVPAARLPPVGAALKNYSHALARAGGNEVASLARPADPSAVQVGLYSAPAYDLAVPALATSRLSVPLTYSRISGALEDERSRTYDAPPHSVFLTPAHTAARWSKDRASRHLIVYFHAPAYDGDARGEGRLDTSAAMGINRALERVLPGMRELTGHLAQELEHPDPFSTEAVDCLARLLLVRLASLGVRAGTPHNPISPLMLERVKDYIQANLSERILVGQLAAVANLPPSRFAVAFTRLTGQAPHQYVLSQRLGQAASLLLRSRQSLASIAATCGFASQQHLTNRMVARFGTTPAQYRASAGDVSATRGTGHRSA